MKWWKDYRPWFLIGWLALVSGLTLAEKADAEEAAQYELGNRSSSVARNYDSPA